MDDDRHSYTERLEVWRVEEPQGGPSSAWNMRGGTKWRGRMYNLDREGCSGWKEQHMKTPRSMHL